MRMDTSLAGTLFAVFVAIVGLAVLTQVLISKDICRLLKYMFKYIQISNECPNIDRNNVFV